MADRELLAAIITAGIAAGRSIGATIQVAATGMPDDWRRQDISAKEAATLYAEVLSHLPDAPAVPQTTPRRGRKSGEPPSS